MLSEDRCKTQSNERYRARFQIVPIFWGSSLPIYLSTPQGWGVWCISKANERGEPARNRFLTLLIICYLTLIVSCNKIKLLYWNIHIHDEGEEGSGLPGSTQLVLPGPAQPCPALPSPARPCLALPGPALPCPATVGGGGGGQRGV